MAVMDNFALQPVGLSDRTALAPDAEWLETDGLGGYATGPVEGPRSRRYHGWLTTALRPPTHRAALLKDVAFVLRGAHGEEALRAQRYDGGILDPSRVARCVAFRSDPHPAWTYALEDGSLIALEALMPRGRAAVVLRLSRLSGPPRALRWRPFLAGVDHHHLQHETAEPLATTKLGEGRVTWSWAASLPALTVRHPGRFDEAPFWYRSFDYALEERRGFDHLEDLWSPGEGEAELGADPVYLFFEAGAPARPPRDDETPERIFLAEKRRRDEMGSSLDRAAEKYFVRRGEGQSVVAGYPWFEDWGRDAFIALRGLATARDDLASSGRVLLEWARHLSEGMLPNRFPDQGEEPEYHSVDAALWFVVAAHEHLVARTRRGGVPAEETDVLHGAILSIVDAYAAGTRHGIGEDEDGLLRVGEVDGPPLTWMDAQVDGRPVTPRVGKPVEIQALWLTALRIAEAVDPDRGTRWKSAAESFRERFFDSKTGGLFDVVDVDHVSGTVDARVRPNQILAVGGLPWNWLPRDRARAVTTLVRRRLSTPGGLRSLDPSDPSYCGRYEGSPPERDGAYHMGTAWLWLWGPYMEAELRCGTDPLALAGAMGQWSRWLERCGLGHISELADGDPPHAPRGAPFQAWSLGEFLRLRRWLHSR
ncbi:MAG TPA: glycogen debranching protein [Planctomycetes bacterium]|nr:glycogen debranching protein [Planctomycetota bacterium]